MELTYFFIDGSSLAAQIRKVWKRHPERNWKRLDPLKFVQFLALSFPDLGSAQYKRAVFYFPQGDQNLSTYFLLPDPKTPGLVRDVNIKYCGEKLDRSSAYETWLESVPAQWQDRCVKSEKGVDIEICCDALRLASLGKMDRLFLLTNDRDFIPLCKMLKDLGTNISVVHLSGDTKPNESLLKECDSYDLLHADYFDQVFESNETGISDEISPVGSEMGSEKLK